MGERRRQRYPPTGASVVFKLYADGEELNPTLTVTLDGAADETVPETAGGYESEGWKAKFVNLPKYKVGKDGKPLTGDDGKYVEITYTIAETTPYPGYTASTTDPVASGGTITNTQIKTKIQIKKIGDWTIVNLLSGVQFKLYSDAACTNQLIKDSTGEVVYGTDGIITTGEGGIVELGSLIPGTYYLQEIATAPGYNLLSGVVEFTINLDGTIKYTTESTNFNSTPGAYYEVKEGETVVVGYGIYINNPSGYELPHTGGVGTVPFTVGGLSLIGIALFLLMKRRLKAE